LFLSQLLQCLLSAFLILVIQYWPQVRASSAASIRSALARGAQLQPVLRVLATGLDAQPRSPELRAVLVHLHDVFPEEEKGRNEGNVYVLAAALLRLLARLTGEDPEDSDGVALAAFMSVQRLAPLAGRQHFDSYLQSASPAARAAYQRWLALEAMGNAAVASRASSNLEYAAVVNDDAVAKLRDDDEPARRLDGARQLLADVRSAADLTPLLPQLRLFLVFLDSALQDSACPQVTVLILQVHGVLFDRLRSRMRPHLPALVASLLRHASSGSKDVRDEAFKATRKLMAAVRPDGVLVHLLEHLGDKRTSAREAVLNMTSAALLTFPGEDKIHYYGPN